jgi:hypothetical protein
MKIDLHYGSFIRQIHFPTHYKTHEKVGHVQQYLLSITCLLIYNVEYTEIVFRGKSILLGTDDAPFEGVFRDVVPFPNQIERIILHERKKDIHGNIVKENDFIQKYIEWYNKKERNEEDDSEEESEQIRDEEWNEMLYTLQPIQEIIHLSRIIDNYMEHMSLSEEIEKKNTITEEIFGQFQKVEYSTSLKDCFICMNSFQTTDSMIRLPCEHVYHQPCIHSWLTKYNNTCPLCRKQVDE